METVWKVNGPSDGEGVFPPFLAEFHQKWMKMFGRVENDYLIEAPSVMVIQGYIIENSKQ